MITSWTMIYLQYKQTLRRTTSKIGAGYLRIRKLKVLHNVTQCLPNRHANPNRVGESANLFTRESKNCGHVYFLCEHISVASLRRVYTNNIFKLCCVAFYFEVHAK